MHGAPRAFKRFVQSIARPECFVKTKRAPLAPRATIKEKAPGSAWGGKKGERKMAQPKTNAMRMLDKAKVNYTFHEYDHSDGAIDGVAVAAKLGQDPARVFKTLVTQGASRAFYVFVIPVAEELDLKAAARAVGEKSVSMLHVADLLKTTGYIRGGCSPVGMKKAFVTTVDASAQDKETIMVSAGRIGAQVELAPADLLAVTGAKYAAITAGKV